MDVTASVTAMTAREVPTGPTVSEMMEEFYRTSGIIPPTVQEIANVSPWTEEEAVAFERSINEAFEQVEDTPGSL